jgi:glycosyltransferase involved in cell wall biosynthesis
LKKIAIVSSYAESCGNATFTKILHDSIEALPEKFIVDIFDLNLIILQSINKKTRVIGDQHIKEICVKLKNYDGVNIQLETGLYGSLPIDIERRLNLLFQSNINVSVTLHSPRLINPTANDVRKSLKKILMMQISSGLNELIAHKMKNLPYEMNARIIKSALKFGCKLIAHTNRAKSQINRLLNNGETLVHPLKMVPKDFIHSEDTLNKIKRELMIEKKKTVGIFGYISAYKGHHDALKALEGMPDEYVLLIFGRQHPQTLSSSGEVDPYLFSLMSYIKKSKKLAGRVFFMGELQDREFMDVASTIDVCWMPYYENGQDGSGIASITLELGKRVLCSSSIAFDELFKLENYQNYRRFDIGNYIELAIKTIAFMHSDCQEKQHKNNPSYNIESQARLYLEALEMAS